MIAPPLAKLRRRLGKAAGKRPATGSTDSVERTRGSGAKMAGFPTARVALLISTAFALAACQPGQNPFARDPDRPAAASPTSVTLVDRDVEAPDVFQTTDEALWDGRPSLGGVWVASPDAVDPERVILRNPDNGKFVIGALFKREAFNPGPKLQISSDAAEALGLLAGQPGKISVTALRREEVAATTDASAPILDANEGISATTLGETAAAAIDAAEGKPAPKPAAKPADGPKAPVVSTAPVSTTTVAPATTAPTPAAAPAPGSATVQIGIFSVESNANRAVETLKKQGVAATSRKETTQGKTWWSVTATGTGRDALLAKVKGLGFTDAYAIR
jgi:cell division septation protein DedD